MAAGGQWTVVFDDKCIIKNNGAEAGTGYAIDDDAFWSQSKFSNIWAIQFGTANPSDTVEYRDETPHSTYEDANLGDFNEFVTRWDAAHLAFKYMLNTKALGSCSNPLPCSMCQT